MRLAAVSDGLESNGLSGFGQIVERGLRRAWGTTVAALFAVGLSACATPPTDDPEAMKIYVENNDPLEPMNRSILSFNQGLETVFLRPVAKGYKAVFPDQARQMIDNFVENLNQPTYALNALLQGNPKGFANAMARLLVNTVTSLGMSDVLQKDVPNVQYDFGATFAKWGIASGPYLMLPVVGPYDTRDAVGLWLDGFADPWNVWATARGAPTVLGITNFTWIRSAVQGLDYYTNIMPVLEDIERTSIDYYAALRSMRRQRRVESLRQMGINLPPPKTN